MDQHHEEYIPRIGALLRRAWEQVYDEVFAGVRAAGFTDVRPMHRPFLRFPPADGLRPGQLAERDQLSKQAVNDLLRDLERLDYLRLEPDPTDGRARIIRLTDRGWAIQRTASTISRDVAERWAASLGQDRIDKLVETLNDIDLLRER